MQGFEGMSLSIRDAGLSDLAGIRPSLSLAATRWGALGRRSPACGRSVKMLSFFSTQLRSFFIARRRSPQSTLSGCYSHVHNGAIIKTATGKTPAKAANSILGAAQISYYDNAWVRHARRTPGQCTSRDARTRVHPWGRVVVIPETRAANSNTRELRRQLHLKTFQHFSAHLSPIGRQDPFYLLAT